jgi:hypothetical protein
LVAICHQYPEHFVLWFRNDQDYFSLIDPHYQYPNHTATPADLQAFSGAAIIISDTPLLFDTDAGASPWFDAFATLSAGLLLFGGGILFGRLLGWRGWVGPTRELIDSSTSPRSKPCERT